MENRDEFIKEVNESLKELKDMAETKAKYDGDYNITIIDIEMFNGPSISFFINSAVLSFQYNILMDWFKTYIKYIKSHKKIFSRSVLKSIYIVRQQCNLRFEYSEKGLIFDR